MSRPDLNTEAPTTTPSLRDTIRDIQEARQPTLPEVEVREFRVASKQKSAASTKTCNTCQSGTSNKSLLLFTVCSSGYTYALEQSNEEGAWKAVTSAAEYPNRVVLVSDDRIGTTAPHVRRQKSIRSFFREYGGMHGVWKSKDGENFELESIVYDYNHAKLFAEFLYGKAERSITIALSMIRGRNDIKEQITRDELDDRGHHLLKEPKA